MAFDCLICAIFAGQVHASHLSGALLHVPAGRAAAEREKNRPAQSLDPPSGRASRLQRCSGSAATEQDLFKTVMGTSKVNWATTLDCFLKPTPHQVHASHLSGALLHVPAGRAAADAR